MGGTFLKTGDSTPGTFLGRDPSQTDPPWPEWQIQAYVIQMSRRAGYLVAAGMEQGERKSAGKAKATGLTAGVPDLRYWLAGGKGKDIELKTAEGKLSKVQIEFHKSLVELGHFVVTVYANSPADGWNQVREILEGA